MQYEQNRVLWILLSSALLRGVRWFESDVSGLPVGSHNQGWSCLLGQPHNNPEDGWTQFTRWRKPTISQNGHFSQWQQSFVIYECMEYNAAWLWVSQRLWASAVSKGGEHITQSHFGVLTAQGSSRHAPSARCLLVSGRVQTARTRALVDLQGLFTLQLGQS